MQTARSAGRKVTGAVDTAAAAAGVIQSARTMQGGDATTGGSKTGTVMNLRAMGAEYMRQNAPVVSSFIGAKEAMRDMMGKGAERTAQDDLAKRERTVVDDTGATRQEYGWSPKGNSAEVQNTDHQKLLEDLSKQMAELKKAYEQNSQK